MPDTTQHSPGEQAALAEVLAHHMGRRDARFGVRLGLGDLTGIVADPYAVARAYDRGFNES